MPERHVSGWNLQNSYKKLSPGLFTETKPQRASDPEMVQWNKEVAESLGINKEWLQSDEGMKVLAGNQLPEGSEPIAQSYAGHQFGHFNRLGDGRAILLGEQVMVNGDLVDIQLKGAGRTPYSRGGDGRAALGPMLREYLISEAMHGLGIPTTRSLAVVETGDDIARETLLPGAILTRVAASHIRVGTFQFAATFTKPEELQALADYTIERHYPELLKEDHPYVALLRKVIEVQAGLIAKWQAVGFIHGVMNTDNMTISGETIDYGPCAFMDTYDPATVFSSIDVQGRYAYGNQPYMAGWNLARFAESLIPLLHDETEEAVKIAQEEIGEYNRIYIHKWTGEMRAKLGLFTAEESDKALIHDLLEIMKEQGADYTNTFIALTFRTLDQPAFKEWIARWQERLKRQEASEAEVEQLMKNHNPAVIPRNYYVEKALTAAVNKGDYHLFEELLAVLAHPYAHTAEQEKYKEVPVQDDNYQTYCGT